MTTFLYCFGFESPRQSRDNAAHGWDDEDSQAVLINAEDEASALLWGTEISEQFVKLLFRDERISWRDQQFAHWIGAAAQQCVDQQEVSIGVFPDFTVWLLPYNGDTRT